MSIVVFFTSAVSAMHPQSELPFQTEKTVCVSSPALAIIDTFSRKNISFTKISSTALTNLRGCIFHWDPLHFSLTSA
jgi:AMMECR1 domain-containing protein